MQTIDTLLVFLTGVFVRLALPVAVTLAAVYFLRRLDLRWQREAGPYDQARVEKPECWKVKDCPAAARRACAGFNSPEPCWQAKRLPSGYLADDCLTCEVLLSAPVPLHVGR
jgi:hypothetical protein